MQGSIERVIAVVNGEMPDRAPPFDLLRNDAVINHFTGKTLTVENAEEVVPEAYPPAVDATRSMRLPGHEETVILENGRERRSSRCTSWTSHKEYKDTAHYVSDLIITNALHGRWYCLQIGTTVQSGLDA